MRALEPEENNTWEKRAHNTAKEQTQAGIHSVCICIAQAGGGGLLPPNYQNMNRRFVFFLRALPVREEKKDVPHSARTALTAIPVVPRVYMTELEMFCSKRCARSITIGGSCATAVGQLCRRRGGAATDTRFRCELKLGCPSPFIC